ncbi:hypothetical protein LWI28_027367 [Acer negundo]|uniref:Uncharacterized protein n=1 Tax=Acer negundo TaxID=4023 RepID=A0AAD5I7Q9_ACENE|nr:hypothetical protein LWI28_027367 [Acer negundo]
MQVSYGRNNRYHSGNNSTGKGNGYGGKPGNGEKHGNGSSSFGVEKPNKGNINGMDIAKSPMKVSPSKKSGLLVGPVLSLNPTENPKTTTTTTIEEA